MKRVLFIDAGDRYQMMQERYSPLWPGYLASYIEKNLGEGKFDFRFLKRSFDKELNSYKPDLVAISSVSGLYSYAMEYARMARKHKLPVVVGGIHISLMPHTLTDDMDVGCIGEGGETFRELLGHFLEYGKFRPERLGGIQGIVYCQDGALVQTHLRPTFKTLDEMPHPKRSILGYHRSDTMLTSRGCPFKCIFCSVTRYWREVNYASVEYVMEEIAGLIDNGVKVIKFYDDLFFFHKKRLKLISEMIISYGFHKKAKFACWARASTLSPEVVDILKAMNMVAVEMGLESGCNRTLNFLKGGGSVEENLKAIIMLKEAGIQANASFIFGAPDETMEEIMETYEFIRKSPLDTVTIGTLIPFPGTPIWDYAKKRGIVSDNMDWRKLHGVILSERLSIEEINALRKKFKRLSLIKRLNALPNSPWLKDLPRVATLRLAGKVMRLTSSLTNSHR